MKDSNSQLCPSTLAEKLDSVYHIIGKLIELKSLFSLLNVLGPRSLLILTWK